MLRPRISSERGWRLAALLFAFVLGSAAMPARADDAGRPMQLEVILNGNPTKLIGSFAMLEGNRLAATPQELKELGLDPRGKTSSGELVVLDQVFGLTYQYDEATQRVSITAPEEQLAVKEYNLRTAPELTPAQADWGGVVNYNVFSSAVSSADARPLAINGVPLTINGIPTKFTGAPIAFNGASATFDARPLIERLIAAAFVITAGAICRRIRQSLDTLLLAVGLLWAFFAIGAELVRLDLATIVVD